jgi:hypothetical protein
MSFAELATVKEFGGEMFVMMIQIFLPIRLTAVGRLTVLPAVVKKMASVVALEIV